MDRETALTWESLYEGGKESAKHAPKALICGILEEGDRMLFLKRKNEEGQEELELPHIFAGASADFVSQLTEAFRKQTDVKAEMGPLMAEGEYPLSEGKTIPAMAFGMIAERKDVAPAPEFTGHEWLGLESAKKRRLSMALSWMKEVDVLGGKR